MSCKDTGMCKTATACFLGGCQDERVAAPLPAAPAFNPDAKCSPFLTQCPRCNNPYHACDIILGVPLPAAPAPTELAGELPSFAAEFSAYNRAVAEATIPDAEPIRLCRAELIESIARAALAARQAPAGAAKERRSPHDELASWKGEAAALREQLVKAREELDLRALHQKSDVWYWVGDGSDEPESFSNSMAILIRGDQLREILGARQEVGAPDTVRDAARLIATGYESGTLATDPTDLGATIHLHYESPAEAENAFCALSNLIDAAIAQGSAS